MKISINVPTYKRAGMVDTFGLLPSANYWVHKFEEKEYRKAHPKMQILVLPDKIRGNIAKVRNHIMLAELAKGLDAMLMVDDDMSHVGYWEARERKRFAGEKEIQAFIERGTRLAKDWGVFLWGINVNPDPQCYREYTPFSTLSYVSASFSCFLKGNELIYDERFSLKEDYDMTLQQLNVHRHILRFNKFFYEKKGAEQQGGCATYRNVEKELGQIKMLQKKWGDKFVKIDRNERSHSSTQEKTFDINPVITVPIAGV